MWPHVHQLHAASASELKIDEASRSTRLASFPYLAASGRSAPQQTRSQLARPDLTSTYACRLHRRSRSFCGVPLSMEKTFTIEINLCETFTIDQIWPDGDAPPDPTIEDVMAAFFRDPFVSVHRRCAAWGLEIQREDLTFTATDPEELQTLRALTNQLRAKRQQSPTEG